MSGECRQTAGGSFSKFRKRANKEQTAIPRGAWLRPTRPWGEFDIGEGKSPAYVRPRLTFAEAEVRGHTLTSAGKAKACAQRTGGVRGSERTF